MCPSCHFAGLSYFSVHCRLLLDACRVGVNRIGFLLESLRDLHNNLEARGSRLLVLRGKPQEVLPRVLKDWAITSLCFEHDTEPYAKERDAQITALAEGLGVQVHEPISHTLYVSDTAHGC